MAELAGEKAQAAHSQTVLESAIIYRVEYVYRVLSWEVIGLTQTAAPACKLGGSGVISPDRLSEH